MTEKNGTKAADAWLFDFSDLQTAGDLMKLQELITGGTMETVMEAMAAHIVSWPLDAEMDDPAAWVAMSIPDWIEGRDTFADAVLSFLDAQGKRQRMGKKAKRNR